MWNIVLVGFGFAWAALTLWFIVSYPWGRGGSKT